ncbi:SigE family RNA polymerase sigma factor [Dactylosporangium sp. NPDC006015]|uniref:SigE family RNA polymerase sigma factor n=1 Tax=Dactylosporangium sp. NPDC006015 TaxID=3154576 RepID=UPI0033B5F268
MEQRPPEGTTRVRVDEEHEYVEYVRAHLPRLHRVAWLVLGDRDRAEDAVQNALTTLYRRWARRGEVDNLDAYVHSMVVRACLSDQRRPWTRVFLRDTPPDHAVEAAIGQVDERLLVHDALRRLPERQRIVVVLRFLCDLPVADVARVLGRSEGTVKAQTSTALRALRELFVATPATGADLSMRRPA